MHQHRQQSHQLTARAVLTQNALGYGWAKSVQSEWLEENLVFLVGFGLTAGDAFQCSPFVRYYDFLTRMQPKGIESGVLHGFASFLILKPYQLKCLII